jgi:Family of unknown function (DUF6134)
MQRDIAMYRATRRPGPLFLAATVLVAWSVYPVWADNTEQRDYEIRVDGKPAGKSRLTIADKDDGTTRVNASGKVEVKLLGLTVYSYTVTSSETWKAGQIVELKCSAVEDGKKTDVDAWQAGQELRIRVNGKNSNAVRADVWPSSYWKLADKKYHNNGIAILDADTGREQDGQLRYIGTEAITIGARARDCYHFSVTGIPIPIDLWFDKHHRLVRQEFTESGHKTLVQLLPGSGK